LNKSFFIEGKYLTHNKTNSTWLIVISLIFVIISPLVFSALSNNKPIRRQMKFQYKPSKQSFFHYKNNQQTNQIEDYDALIDSNGSLHLVFTESIGDSYQLGYKHTLTESTSAITWKTKPYYLVENQANTIRTPMIQQVGDTIYVLFVKNEGVHATLEILSRTLTSEIWNNFSSYSLVDNFYGTTELQFILGENSTVWLFGTLISPNTIDLYYTQYSFLDNQWSNWELLATNVTSSTHPFKAVKTSDDNIHLVWSKGNQWEHQLYYQIFFPNNHSVSSKETLSDGTTSCRHPELCVDKDDNLHLFWSEYIEPERLAQMGVKSIYYSTKKVNESWTEAIEVGPYIPPGRPTSGESDGMKPEVVIDKEDILWMAYEIREEYAYHQGVDLRNKNGNSWNPSVKISLRNNPAIEPLLLVDDNNYLHCFWLDFRSGAYHIYYRYKTDDNRWSEEKGLTWNEYTMQNFWGYFGIIIAIIVLLSIPFIIYRIFLRRRRKKILGDKIDKLETTRKIGNESNIDEEIFQEY
jgi:hypothetical protein